MYFIVIYICLTNTRRAQTLIAFLVFLSTSMKFRQNEFCWKYLQTLAVAQRYCCIAYWSGLFSAMGMNQKTKQAYRVILHCNILATRVVKIPNSWFSSREYDWNLNWISNVKSRMNFSFTLLCDSIFFQKMDAQRFMGKRSLTCIVMQIESYDYE